MYRTFSLLTLCVASTILGGCNLGPQVSGSGEIITESRQLPPFSGIDVDGATDIEVVYGATQSVKVIGDDNIVPIISTEVEGGVLYIEPEKPYSTSRRVRLEITLPVIRSIAIGGSADVSVRGTPVEVSPVESFDLLIEGSGDVDIAEMNATSVDVDVEGSGNVDLSGTGTDISLRIEGSGDIDASRFIAEKGEAVIEGSGNIRLHVGESLRGTISGAGSIGYAGNPPSVEKNISGSGTISPL